MKGRLGFVTPSVLILVTLGVLSACTQPTVTPTPTETPPPSPMPPPVTIPSTRFGITWSSSFYMGHRVDPPGSPEQKAADIGATWDRWDFQWSRVERPVGAPPENWLWEEIPSALGDYSYEAAISGDESANPPLSIIGILNGGLLYYTREQGKEIEGIFLNAFDPGNRWGQFVLQTVRKYKDRIDVWEIGNETGVPEALQPDNYIQAVKVACEIIHQEDPGARVVLGAVEDVPTLEVANVGLGVANTSNPHWWTSNWQKVLTRIGNDFYHNQDVEACINAISLHSYARPQWSRWMIEGIRAFLNQSGWRPDVDLWITESGVQSGDRPGCHSDKAGGCDYHNAEQAAYVMQQYALAMQGMANVGRPNGLIFHHRLRDDPVDGTFGLLRESDNAPWPSYRAAWLITQKLEGATFIPGAGNDVPVDQETTFAPDYKHLVFLGRDGRYIHVLWATRQHTATATFAPIGDGAVSGEVFRQTSAESYHNGMAPDRVQVVNGNFTLELPAATAIAQGGGNDPFRESGQSVIGGEVYILIESRETASPPTGSAALVCENGRVVGTDLLGRDESAGLATLTASCTPAVTYDLSWTQPGHAYGGTVSAYPPVGGTCTLTLTNKAGLSTQQTLYHPPDLCRGGGGGGSAGGDHPDDNFSAAGIPEGAEGTLDGDFFVLPEGARVTPRVAILNSDFAHHLWRLVLELGEPADFIGVDFDPVTTAAQYPVLLIPSGGLYGLENDAAFRARLEEYARQGGVIAAFAQQHGYEYAALPGATILPPGGGEPEGGQGLSGYGWAEDISCFRSSLYLSTWHPLLSGFDHLTLDAHVDGYFTSVPDGAQVLLSRRVNGMPAAVLYPYPSSSPTGGTEGGYVFATTIYDDWGALNGQTSADARTLLRDLLTWAIPPSVPPTGGEEEYAPGDALTLTLPITNTMPYTVTAVALRLVDPARQVVLTRTHAITIPASSAATVPFTTTAATPLGLWRIDVSLLNDQFVIRNSQFAARFAVADPAELVDLAPELSLNVTAPADRFILDTGAAFTFIARNTGDVTQTVELQYGLPHHTWETGDPSYGEHDNNHVTLTLPPNGVAQHLWPTAIRASADRLWARLVREGRVVAQASFGVYGVRGAVFVNAATSPDTVQRDGVATLNLTVGNTSGAPLAATLHVRAVDAARTLYHTATLTVAVPAQRADVWPWWPVVTHTFTVPHTVASGRGQVWVEAYSAEGRALGGGVMTLDVPTSPLVFAAQPPLSVNDAHLAVPLTLTNTAAHLPIAAGVLTLTLSAPGGITATTAATFTLAPLASQALTLPLDLPPLRFGVYMLVIESTDEYGARRHEMHLPATLLAQARLDQASYRVRETAAVALTLDNAGPFRLPLTVTLAAPALSYAYTQPLTLDPDAEDALSWDIPLPSDVTAGSYPLYITATLPSGDVWKTLAGPLVVPPAWLEWDADVSPAATAGNTLEPSLYNAGGVDAEAAVSLQLTDARGLVVAAQTEQVVMQAGNEQGFALTVPAQARSGVYTLLAEAALPGAEPVHAWRLVQIDGVTAGLTATTDKERYTFWDSLDAAATIANGPRPLSDAQLQLEIVQAEERLVPAWERCLFGASNCGLSGNALRALAIDAGGNRWFGTVEIDEGISVSLDRLAADGETWQTFAPPVWDQEITDLAVGSDGRVWLGFSPGINSQTGVAVLSGTTWSTYSAADSGLLSDAVVHIAPDAAGNVWFATHTAWDDALNDYRDGGLSVLRADNTWITYTTANSGLLTETLTGLAVDAAGNVWVAGAGLSQLRADGVWITYTTANSPLLTDSPTDVAVDASGAVWVAGDGLSRLQAGNWLTYTTANSGLQSNQINHLAAGADGCIWAGANEGYVQVYDPATDAGVLYALPGQTYSEILDLAVGPDPDEVWIGTGGGVVRYRAPVVATRVLWQETFPINLDASAQADVPAYLNPVAALGAPGKFYLQARLLAATGQELAAAARPFYVDPDDANGCALTMNLTPTVAAPSQPLQVYGEITSQYSDYEGVQLAVTLDGATIVVSDALTLPYGIPVPYTLTLPAPDRAGVFLVTTELRLSAESAPVTLNERLVVDAPALEAALVAPTVAGRAPFNVALTLENPTSLDLALTVTRDGAPPENLTLPAGERALRLWSHHITTDTVLGVTLSGDVAQVLTQSVAFGEGLAVAWTPESRFLPGQVSVPYTFTNTGQLDLTFTTYVTLTGVLEEEIAATAFTHSVLAGSASAGQIVFADIPPGDYIFSASTPWSADAFSLTVRLAEAAALDVDAAPVVGSTVTVTAHVTNTGATPLEAVVHVQAPFDTLTPVILAPAEALTLPLALDLAACAPGAWPVTLTVETGGGAILASAITTVAVSPADLVVTAVPTSARVTAGETVALTFGVANRGAAPGTAVLTVTLGNLLDETQRLWLPGGAEGTLAFTFDAPVGLSGEALVGYYHFGGQRYDLALPIDGVGLSVNAGWDQLFYDPGVTATLRLTVTNHGTAATPPLYAAVDYGSAALTQPLTLAGGATQLLDFPLTAGDYTGDTLVFYAVYEEEEQRGIHLNTTYLRLRQPVVTLIPDRTVYRPGDTVRVAVVTTATGAITVSAPGLSPTSYSLFPTPSIQFTLPDNLPRGTYTLDYELTLPPTGGEPAGGSVPFDVDAPWVRVIEADLLDSHLAPGGTLQADGSTVLTASLTVASTDALTVTLRSWLRYPNGTLGAEVTRAVALQAASNNHLTVTLPFSTTQAGPHRLVYLLTDSADPEHIYAVGVENFTVGAVAILGLRTERDVYPGATDPVTAALTLHATSTTSATLELLLDGAPATGNALTLTAGVHAVALALPGSLSPGQHTVTARVTAGGLVHAQQHTFAYGVGVVDLVAGTPQLLAGSGPTRTLRLWAYNRGATDSFTTTLQVWDGDPDAGGTLLGALLLPPLAPGANRRGELPWNVLGQAGVHPLTSVADPDNLVAEFYEGNNRAAGALTLPPFDVRLVVPTTSYAVGEPVSVTVWATNLAAVPATLVLTTTAGSGVFTDVRTLAVPAAAQASAVITWNTAGQAEGSYALYTQGTNQDGAAAQAMAYVYLYALLTPPQVDLGPDRSVAEGSPITFTATITDPDTPSGHILHWDFGDGETAGGTLTPTYVYADDGVYLVTLAVTDTTGLSGSGHLTITVVNVAPTVGAGPDRTVAVSETLACNGVFTDPGVLDTHTIAWDFGDGITATGVLTPTHAYTQPGVYTVTLVVADDDGGTDSDALVVTVNAAGPGVISGVIWNDLDGNGVQNGTEPGLAGVYVMLFADDGGGLFAPEAGDPGVTYTVT